MRDDTITTIISENKILTAMVDGHMTALVCERYGGPDVLKFAQLARPAPKRGEVLVRVMASTITSGDRRVRSMDVPYGFRTLGRLALGWRGPRNPVLGATFAGVVEAVGQRASGFAPGDAVFGISGFRMGGHAEYLCLPAKGAIAHKPADLSFEEAAALPFGGGTALSFLSRAKLQAGETILVNGASGNVGMAVVQLASDMGAVVTGVCRSSRSAQVRALGAERVIDYQQEDFTATRQRFDVVFDVACNRSVARCLQVVKPGGRLIRLLSDLPEMLGAIARPSREGRRIIVGTAEESADNLKHLASLVVQRRYRPVISRVFPFAQAIEAHRYAECAGHGESVVIKMKDDSQTADAVATGGQPANADKPG